LKKPLLIFLFLIFAPIAASAARYFWLGDGRGNWQTADATLAGYVGVTVGWVEGVELNFFGAVLGFDLRRPALKLPGLGRVGVTAGL
jgi:hypothetical protein